MKKNIKILVLLLATSLVSVGLIGNGCSGNGFRSLTEGENSAGSTTGPVDPGPGGPSSPIVAGNGANFSGKGALSVPTTTAIVARIQQGLENNVDPTRGNFATALAQVKTNLPTVSDPSKATGFDQIQLLAYAACSDLTTGTTPLMQSKYSVTKAATIANSQTALIAMGVKIMDQFTANLASQSSASTDVNSALNDLVNQLKATASNTSTIAFMSVCMASLTAGTTLLGF